MSERIERECAQEIAKIYYAPPDTLSPRVLKGDELKDLKTVCLTRLGWSRDAKETLMVIDDFVKFCALLSKPENHIKKPAGQYVEKQVPLRTVADMVNEMRGELTDLPNFTAYAKIMQEKHKITTFALPEKWPDDVSAHIQQEILERTHWTAPQKVDR